MLLLVRKNRDDKISKDFYYLSRITAKGKTREFIIPNTDNNDVEISYILDTLIRDDLYNYITG